MLLPLSLSAQFTYRIDQSIPVQKGDLTLGNAWAALEQRDVRAQRVASLSVEEVLLDESPQVRFDAGHPSSLRRVSSAARGARADQCVSISSTGSTSSAARCSARVARRFDSMSRYTPSTRLAVRPIASAAFSAGTPWLWAQRHRSSCP